MRISCLIISLVFFVLAAGPARASEPDPSKLAASLAQRGVTMYGAFWCPHCQEQKKMFGDAFEHVNYVECGVQPPAGSPIDHRQQTEACKAKNIHSYPTWVFTDGKGGETERISKVLQLQELADKIGYPPAECSFDSTAKAGKPWNVDNTCKGKLDDLAKSLQQNPDKKLVVVGNATKAEKSPPSRGKGKRTPPIDLPAERAVNIKAYLTGSKDKPGIDTKRIETFTGSDNGRTAELWMMPASASFSETGTQPVDESKVKPMPDSSKPAGKKAKPAAQP